jgi:hypothetical protein
MEVCVSQVRSAKVENWDVTSSMPNVFNCLCIENLAFNIGCTPEGRKGTQEQWIQLRRVMKRSSPM